MTISKTSRFDLYMFFTSLVKCFWCCSRCLFSCSHNIFYFRVKISVACNQSSLIWQLIIPLSSQCFIWYIKHDTQVSSPDETLRREWKYDVQRSIFVKLRGVSCMIYCMEHWEESWKYDAQRGIFERVCRLWEAVAHGGSAVFMYLTNYLFIYF